MGTTVFEASTPDADKDAVNGYINRTFNNTGGHANDWCEDKSSFFLGTHAWKGGTTGHDYVKDNVSDSRNFTLMGSL